jgi:hypothetical protein
LTWLESKKLQPADSKTKSRRKHRPLKFNETYNTKNIGERIKLVRILKGVSRETANEELLLRDWHEVDRFEKGEKRFHKGIVSRFGKAYGISDQWLTTGVGFMTDSGIAMYKVLKNDIDSRHYYIYENGIRDLLPKLIKTFDQVNILTMPKNRGAKYGEDSSWRWQLIDTFIYIFVRSVPDKKYLVIQQQIERLAKAIMTEIKGQPHLQVRNMGNVSWTLLPKCFTTLTVDEVDAYRQINSFVRADLELVNLPDLEPF